MVLLNGDYIKTSVFDNGESTWRVTTNFAYKKGLWKLVWGKKKNKKMWRIILNVFLFLSYFSTETREKTLFYCPPKWDIFIDLVEFSAFWPFFFKGHVRSYTSFWAPSPYLWVPENNVGRHVIKISESRASSLDWPLAFGTFGLRVNPKLTF